MERGLKKIIYFWVSLGLIWIAPVVAYAFEISEVQNTNPIKIYLTNLDTNDPPYEVNYYILNPTSLTGNFSIQCGLSSVVDSVNDPTGVWDGHINYGVLPSQSCDGLTPENGQWAVVEVHESATVACHATTYADLQYDTCFVGQKFFTFPFVATTTSPTPTIVPLAAGRRADGSINVAKLIINNSGGTKNISDFPLFVNGNSVVSGVTKVFPAADHYAITETQDSNYVQTFSGDCDSTGHLNIGAGFNRFCIITNDDIGAPLLLPPPLIDVLKVPSPLALPAGPGPVTYTYSLHNLGIVPVTNITMVGDTCSPVTFVSGDTNNDSKLDVTETWIYACTMNLSQTTTNIITATGQANGITAVDTASATVVVGAALPPPLIHIVKKPNVFILPAGGGAVTYSYVVSNPGIAPLSNVIVTDDKCTGLPGRVLGHPGDLNKNNLLESNEAWSFTCETNLTQTTTNTGKAEGRINGLTATDFSPATVIVGTPGLPNTGLALTMWQQIRRTDNNLQQGNKGNDVTVLQQFLISQNKGPSAGNLSKAGATGYFGALTRAALAEFQRDAGISPPLGNFGPLTRDYLKTNY